VIARSFAFIFNRNMRTLGLLGLTITDNAFYEALADGDGIHIDVESQIVVVNEKQFAFELSDIERELIARKGAVEGYKLLGGDLWERMTTNSATSTQEPPIGMLEREPSNGQSLDW
jgi:3-isopropylmalate dehydratase small subunit